MVVLVRDNGDSDMRVTPQISESDRIFPKVRLLQVAMVLLSSFFIAELTAALCSHSLSLLADAGHVLSDVAALGLTLAATWWSSRKRSKVSSDRKNLLVTPHSCNRSSPHRVETVAAIVNALSLVAIALWIAIEAIARLQSPTPDIEGLPMLLTAIIGLTVNCINAFFLHPCCHNDLNLKSAFLHIIADICSSLGVILAAIAVAWLHWTWADGLISLLVSASMIFLTLPLLIQSLHLLQGIVPTNSLPQPPCNCDKKQLEKLLFPSLDEIIK